MDPVLIPWWPDGGKALGVGRTKMHELVTSGEVESVTIGRRRLVTTEGVRAYVARKLDQEKQARGEAA
jgi:excisionase family DNA binding protein